MLIGYLLWDCKCHEQPLGCSRGPCMNTSTILGGYMFRGNVSSCAPMLDPSVPCTTGKWLYLTNLFDVPILKGGKTCCICHVLEHVWVRVAPACTCGHMFAQDIGVRLTTHNGCALWLCQGAHLTA